MPLDNDTRGWVMTAVSGIACVAGASIICVDLIVQRVPRYRNWRIQDSTPFLSSSLSLSFGVMLFSALYNMLPSSNSSLIKGGLSPKAAGFALIGCFMGGVIGIQFISRLLHHYIPSHVVDCDHTHMEMDEDEDFAQSSSCGGDHGNSHGHENGHADHHENENTPLLSREECDLKPRGDARSRSSTAARSRPEIPYSEFPESRRPSLQQRLTRKMTQFMVGSKAHCDEGGPCHGYSDPCGQECYKAKALPHSPNRTNSRPSISAPHRHSIYRRPTLDNVAEETGMPSLPVWSEQNFSRGRQNRRQSSHDIESAPPFQSNGDTRNLQHSHSVASTANPAHHHHVPTNTFLAIGLQTSIAIALHKLPEGFITYATNHANPKLGFSVFMALFIHNITEGFALALPLFLAIGSRTKAMFWSSLLGGFSQPLGAGIAALWFHAAGTHHMAPNETVYGCMFAVTSGIMTSVGLQLFSESLGLTHNKGRCVFFAFVGIGILGVSNALTA